MRMSIAFVTVLIVVLLNGCATGPKYSEVAATLGAPAADEGRIYIYRIAVLGAAVQPDVKFDGVVVGQAVPGGFFYVDKPPGQYRIETSTEVDRHLSLTLDAGQVRYVRLNIGIGFFVGHVYPELVEPTVGQEEIQKTSYTANP